MSNSPVLDKWFGDTTSVEDEVIETIVPREGAEQSLFDWQENVLQHGANYIKRHAVQAIVVASTTGMVIGCITKGGLEIGFPLGAGVVCMAMGTGVLVKKLRGARANGDSKGIGVIRR